MPKIYKGYKIIKCKDLKTGDVVPVNNRNNILDINEIRTIGNKIANVTIKRPYDDGDTTISIMASCDTYMYGTESEVLKYVETREIMDLDLVQYNYENLSRGDVMPVWIKGTLENMNTFVEIEGLIPSKRQVRCKLGWNKVIIDLYGVDENPLIVTDKSILENSMVRKKFEVDYSKGK